MRARRVLLAVLLPVLLALGAPTAAAAGQAPSVDAMAFTDRLVFSTPIEEFVAIRQLQVGPAAVDWSSDGCSVPVLHEPQRSMPHGFDFRAACERHDFGYRNEKRQGRFTEESRHRIDDVFRADMDAVCAPQSGWFGWRERLCGRVAGDYYFWVRSCGANPAPYCPLVARDWVEERVES